MELHLKESERWIRQAEYDLKASEWNLEGGFHAQACFWAQQAAAKTLRAFLFLMKEDYRESRSVVELLERAIAHDESFKQFVEKAGRIDIYYKTARFPDAIPGGVPSEIISDRDAKEAINTASEILTVAEEKRKDHTPESF